VPLGDRAGLEANRADSGAWKEPQPFGWQGRHFHYRTVSVWPRPLQQPLPPMYALGTSSEASDFAARNHIGLGVSFGPFDVMGKVTGYYKEECARYGWQPEPHQIIYRANILIAETDEKAQQALAQYPREAVFPLKAGVGAALFELDQRTVAGEGRRPAHVNRVLPINFCGGPDEIVAQLKQCREQIGAGVVDLSFQTPGSETSCLARAKPMKPLPSTTRPSNSTHTSRQSAPTWVTSSVTRANLRRP
jgi:alkanesulfonate monooxygenase SsuD/methylene tetrahydromethanopterin reductase-like flavin-dependent oxidoreductase (luciferase family)